MKKILIALVALTMILTVGPSAMGAGGNYIDQSTGWDQSWPTDAQIVLGGAGDSTGPSGSPGADAPKIHFAWVWEDEDLTTPGTQVTCVPSGFKYCVEVKIVISDPNGLMDIEDVKAQIIYPEDIWPWCGCPKFKVSAEPLPNDQVENQAFLAKHAGLITGEEYDKIIYNVLDQPNWTMYVAYFDMWYCEPAGYYDVLVWGVDGAFQVGEVYSVANCLSGSAGFGFEFVECLTLEYDFTALNYGNIRPSVTQYIQGDKDLNTPQYPTVKNEGNVPIHIRIKSSPLVMENTQYEIDEFDYKFKGEIATYPADTWVDIGPTLCVCNTEKLDLSIHAREGLPQGHYSGTFYMQIYVGSWGNICETTV
jgi:hypothetical protein